MGPEGHTEPPASARRLRGPLRDARHALGPVRARAAEERGAAMSPATAAEYALSLTAPARAAIDGRPGRLSARERELVTLVAQGRTDAQIAAQLYISIRTVRSHLDRIRDKTGCRRRADLTRLALSAGLDLDRGHGQPPDPRHLWVVLPRPPSALRKGYRGPCRALALAGEPARKAGQAGEFRTGRRRS